MKNKDAEIVKNRKAFHDYEILDSFEAGIVLTGTEIKSIRATGASLQEAYIQVLRGELYLIGAHIAPYSHGSIYNHQERRDRKLLMHRREITKLKESSQEKGLALIPLSLYFKKGKVKMSVALCKGKKLFDKRESMKERDEKRRMDAAKKSHA